MKKITFKHLLWAAIFCSIAARFVGRWLGLPSLHAVVLLLFALASMVYPVIPEEWDSHYQGERGRRIVRLCSAALMLFIGLLLFLDLKF